MNKEKVKEWLKKRDNQLLVLLLLFAAIVLLYYYFRLGEQPIWWDEGDYLSIAKVWALHQPIPEWWSHFTGMRPLAGPIIFAAFFSLGFSELALRFFALLIPAFFIILLTYLIGRDMYDKKTGVIAAFMMSVYWCFLFYSFRLLSDIPSIFFGMLSLYFFWSIYLTRKKNYGIYLSVIFGVLAFSTRFALSLVLISIFLFMLLIRRVSLFKDKVFWKSAGVFALSILPITIYFIYTKFFAFSFYFVTGTSVKQPIAWSIIPMIFSFLGTYWGIALVLGILSLFSLVVGLDIVWKQKNSSLNADFFITIFIVIHLIFYIIIIRAANDRWLLMLMPVIFILSAKGILFFSRIISKYSSIIGLLFILVLVFGGAYQSFSHATQLIEDKKSTYIEEKEAGLWLKDNTPLDTKIMTASIVQNQYYSERQSYDYYTNSTIWNSCPIDPQNPMNATCENATKLEVENKIQMIKPDYLLVSVFEPYFTPTWMYTYPQEKNLTVVKVFSNAQNQPMLVIYKL